jgi:hypothetical protein
MKKSYLYLVGIVVIASAVVIAAGYSYRPSPNVAGDFPGGVTPTTLFTASSGASSISPISGLPNFYIPGATSVGGTGLYDQLSIYATASTTPLTVATLGPLGSTTSSATTTASIQVAGLAIGDICSGGAATTTVYVSGCVVTAVSGGNATATVAFSNITGSNLSVPTSTVIRVSLDHLPY